MKPKTDLAKLHLILEDLKIYVISHKFTSEDFHEKVKEEFNNVNIHHSKNLSRQAYDMLINYCNTEEEAKYVLSELKGCLIPVAYA